MEKLLIISPYYKERHRWTASTVALAENLCRELEVTVLAAGPPGVTELNPRLKLYAMRDFFIPDPVNYGVMPGLFPQLLRIIRKERPDFFLVNKFMFFSSGAIPLLRALGKPVIVVTDTFPGYTWFPRSPLVAKAMRSYFCLLGRPLLKMANRVVLTHEGLLPAAKRLNLDYIVIPQGVDWERFAKAAPPDPPLKHRRETLVAYIGRLESVKGWELLLKAAKPLLSTHPVLRLIMVGDCSGKEKLLSPYRHPQLNFLGYREDIPALLAAADILVLPSYDEGLPNALLEGMAAGKACLAARVGGVPTVIQDGVNGLLFTPGSAGELAEKLSLLLKQASLRRRLGAAARETIVAHYSFEIVRKQYLRLLLESRLW